MLLLLLMGITLAASTVTWWNGELTAEVKREIADLERHLEVIRAADRAKRSGIVNAYIERLLALVAGELEGRNSIATELTICRDKAVQIVSERFGGDESVSFRQCLFELDLALGQVQAERAYLMSVQRILPEYARRFLEGDSDDLPGTGILALPVDFPREGGLVTLPQVREGWLHGYRLIATDAPFVVDRRGLLVSVDHQHRSAVVCAGAGALFEAATFDGGQQISAQVVDRDDQGIVLQYQAAELSLVCGWKDHQDLQPGQTVDVFPDIWRLQDIARFGARRLRVQRHQRVSGSRERWSPIPLAVSDEQLPALVEAYQKIEASGDMFRRLRIHVADSGRIAFSLGKVTILTHVDEHMSAFRVQSIAYDLPKSVVSLGLHAELTVFVIGGADETNADRSLFMPFVLALHHELDAHKAMLSQRQSASRLRKLSLIYQDQQQHYSDVNSCGFVAARADGAGRVVEGVLVGRTEYSWLTRDSKDAEPRLRISGQSQAFQVARFEWVDQPLGACRLELKLPKGMRSKDIDHSSLNRLERAMEGNQQETLSRALENAVLGKFASANVRDTLMGLSPEVVTHQHKGRDEVMALLQSKANVVAIWGPPGTGKTTLMVDWLKTIFKQGLETQWPRILITAPTHVAVDNLLSRLRKEVPWLEEEIVRYGSADRIEGTPIETRWQPNLLKSVRGEGDEEENNGELRRDWLKLLDEPSGYSSASRWLLGPRKIHAVTCVGMARQDYALSRSSFDIAIIDEAGKAFGAELLLPAAVAHKVVLVGDHNQLPPTVTSEMLSEEVGYRLPLKEVEALLKENMFQQWFDQLPAGNKGMLTVQHRMDEHIGQLVSRLFYDDQLQSSRHQPGWTLTRKRTLFLDFSEVTSYKHKKVGASKSSVNGTERAALLVLIRQLAKRKEARALKFLIICPYEAQKESIKDALAQVNLGFSCAITTVDAVQGDEADIVILLFTRSYGPVEFLLDRNRINVALSRAREAVIILGHLQCLTKAGQGPVAELITLGTSLQTVGHSVIDPTLGFNKSIGKAVFPDWRG